MPKSKPLGRLKPLDYSHVDKYPLSALPDEELPVGSPVVIGIDWYRNFDNPQKDGARYWIGRGSLGAIRGGHCVCIKGPQLDQFGWWTWYDQVSEGICVSEGISRMMSLLNRKRYQPRPLYDEAQAVDEWPGEDYDGTSVRAGLSVAQTKGMVPAKRGEQHHVRKGEVDRPFVDTDGIAAYRWATSADQVLTVLNLPLANSLGAVPILNSWGRDYPQKVWMEAEVLQKLIDDGGEVGLVTDR